MRKMPETLARVTLLGLFVVTCAVGLRAASAQDRKQAIQGQIASLVDKGSVVLYNQAGEPVIEINPDEMLMPASILKILTARVAFDVLGPDYRFKTDIYRNADGAFAVKGWGDPYLISEELDTISTRLAQRGLTRVSGICLDNSSFVPNITIPGVSRTTNPYDAINGALAANFNTVYILKDAKGSVLSAEEATPLTPLAASKATILSAGSKQRINLTANPSDCLRYAGELFAAFLGRAGIEVASKDVRYITIDDSWEKVYTHENTRTLTTVVEGLMKYSNNFIANQIFLTVGAARAGYPASLDKSQKFFQSYIVTNLDLPPDEIVIREGSGISRENRTTGRTMITVLQQFRDHADLLAPKDGVPVKSGTLTGVYNYAGYVRTPKGLCPFVIMLNQQRNTRDRILRLVARYAALSRTASSAPAQSGTGM